MNNSSESPFKSNDIRGVMPGEINPDFAYALGCSIASTLHAKRVAIGRDCRNGGEDLFAALCEGLGENGAESVSLGMCCTEEVYFASMRMDVDAGVMITASHNPANENGFKIVRKNGVPVGMGSGLEIIKADVMSQAANSVKPKIKLSDFQIAQNARKNFANWLYNYCKLGEISEKKLKIVADAGNGCAGLVLKELASLLPFELIVINGEPDGSFPNGVPNPLLPYKRQATANAVLTFKADFGCAFDGDADRCFFFDNSGNFIESYYIVGAISKALAQMNPGEKFYHDTRLYWNTEELVRANGGIPVMGKAGHSRIKKLMAEQDVAYGGEMSGHHYFRDFSFCDSGFLPMLLVARLLAKTGGTLEEMVTGYISAYPCSGEINIKVGESTSTLTQIKALYAHKASRVDLTDGLNLEFADWRFSLRQSSTEPLLRLNIETRGDMALLEKKTKELLEMIGGENS